MTIEINGMAHVILTVSRFEVAREFYCKLLPEFGMKPVFDGDKLFYCVGARTAIGIEPCDPALAGERFVQQRVGLHHLCLRARSREDVDRCAALLKEMDATIVRGPMEGSWAPGYYYVLFEDPDGIRLEVNFVPGAGLLADGAQFNPATGYVCCGKVFAVSSLRGDFFRLDAESSGCGKFRILSRGATAWPATAVPVLAKVPVSSQ